jgi:hypothetical protein
MATTDDIEHGAGWRLATRADSVFLYELIAAVDPRWWRFSRHGLEPSRLLGVMGQLSSGAVVFDGRQRPVAFAALADTGAAGTGAFEFFALPDPRSTALARRFAPELVAAAFAATQIRRLYRERFEGDTDLYGDIDDWFEVEVIYPDFALIDGRYESRIIDVVTRERFLQRTGGRS